jgi:solute carrier family 13 (sodium-dependent dicarboxylate transporter), member 2/3/5
VSGGVPEGTTRGRVVALIASAGAAAVVWFVVPAMDPVARHALAIGVFMVLAWITHALDPAVTGLVGGYLFWALGVVTFPVAFGGFADSTTWFVFAAILLGAMATRTGLPRRMAFLILRGTGTSYSRVLLGLIVADLVLTLFVPSGVARVMVMAPVAIGLVEAFGLGPGSNVGRGLFVVMTYAATVFDKMILGGLAAITARSAMEHVGHVEVLWSRWALACAPGAAITVVAAWRLALWLFPPERSAIAAGDTFVREAIRSMGPWSTAEKKAALLLVLALGLWATDALHHWSPALVGLGFGLAALLPGIGVLDADDLRRVNLLPMVFVGCAISMGNVLTATGALAGVTAALTRALGPLVHDLRGGSVVLYGAACVYHLLIGNEIAMVATSMPSMMQFARAQGLDPLSVGMIWTLGSGGKLFLYQSAVLIVGHSYGYFDRRDLLRIGVWMTLVEGGVVLLLSACYWPLLGIS